MNRALTGWYDWSSLSSQSQTWPGSPSYNIRSVERFSATTTANSPQLRSWDPNIVRILPDQTNHAWVYIISRNHCNADDWSGEQFWMPLLQTKFSLLKIVKISDTILPTPLTNKLEYTPSPTSLRINFDSIPFCWVLVFYYEIYIKVARRLLMILQ